MDRHLIGRFGEIIASRYLRYHGFDIVSAHYNCRLGEIDIIAEDKKFICFVEVKARNANMLFTPADAVDHSKRNKIIAASQLYLKDNTTDKQPRFDIIEVYFEEDVPVRLNHIENAFDGQGH